MLQDLILQNPIISLLLVSVSIAGIVWKVVHALYVKPRDFRITTMEKDVEALRNEILKIEKARQATNAGKSEDGTDAEHGALSTGSTVQKNERLTQSEHKSTISNEVVLNDLQDLLGLWNNKEITDLQRKHIEEIYTNKPVAWEVLIKSVGEVKDGKIYVSVVSPKSEFQLDTAVAYFDENYKEALLLVKKGESVVISGTIERFFLSPILKDCKITRK